MRSKLTEKQNNSLKLDNYLPNYNPSGPEAAALQLCEDCVALQRQKADVTNPHLTLNVN